MRDGISPRVSELLERFDELQHSDEVPEENEYPGTPWRNICNLGDKYLPAFKVQTQEDADIHLLMLVGHSLRYVHLQDKDGAWRPLTWHQAFARERECLAWSALAHDLSYDGPLERVRGADGEFLRKTEGGVDYYIYRERTIAQDFARKYYQAELPEKVRINAVPDIAERARLRAEKSAKSKGVVYWRKRRPMPSEEPTEQQPEPQGSLF